MYPLSLFGVYVHMYIMSCLKGGTRKRPQIVLFFGQRPETVYIDYGMAFSHGLKLFFHVHNSFGKIW